MDTQERYSMNLVVKYAPLELIDLQALVDACTEAWYNQTLCRVNDSVVRLGVVQGTTIPKGVLHRPQAPERTVILMVERAGVSPTGNK